MAEPAEQPSNGDSVEGAGRPAEAMAGAEEEPAKVEQEEGGRETAASAAPLAESSSWEEHECRICYNRFDLGRRAPKLLECLHTFCQECLTQLHLRAILAAQSQRRGAAEGGGHQHDTAITCPLCRHCTSLPDCRVHSLPLNTKLVDHISLRAAWSALAGSQRQALLLLPVPRPAQQRPPSERSSQGATPPSSADGARSALAQQCSGGLGGGCSCSTSDQSWRRKAVNLGCLCVVFCVLSMLLLFFAWMNWLTGSIFIGVAVLLLFVSTVPFAKHGFRHRTGAAGAVALLAPAGTNGPGGAVAAYNVTPRSRPAADRRTRS
ncbi:RING finger protein 223 [Heteronotia binoei]|uniref:RING finger protein 223 n=1 Tax=Heteronotia binoei TaxID=13085 RepID=UPI00292ED3E4|nr:RING finger protein 223 [Heteronotia binoei]